MTSVTKAIGAIAGLAFGTSVLYNLVRLKKTKRVQKKADPFREGRKAYVVASMGDSLTAAFSPYSEEDVRRVGDSLVEALRREGFRVDMEAIRTQRFAMYPVIQQISKSIGTPTKVGGRVQVIHTQEEEEA